MLKEICFIKIVLVLFALSVSTLDDDKLRKQIIFDENGHSKSSFYKHFKSFLQPINFNDDNSIDLVSKQRKYDELLEQLRTVLTFILSNPDYIHYLPNFEMPVYNIDVRPVEDFESENVSLILRAKSVKKNNKKASDSSDSSESDDKDKQNLRYESCRRGKKKCVKACKSSYREACYLETCYWALRRKLRKMCKESCRRDVVQW